MPLAHFPSLKAAKGGRGKKYDGKLAMDETTLLFNKKVAPSLRLATRIGPQHTVATYTNIPSLMITKGAANLVGKTINCYSYGSGAAATMFRLKVKRMPGYVKDMHALLDQRNFLDASGFDAIMDECVPWTPTRTPWTPPNPMDPTLPRAPPPPPTHPPSDGVL